MGFAWVGLAQIRNSLCLDGGNHDILVTVGFLLAAVVPSLLLRLFWSLRLPFDAINYGSDCILLVLLAFLELFGSRSGSYPRSSKACFKIGNKI